jgi:hypothetical protein
MLVPLLLVSVVLECVCVSPFMLVSLVLVMLLDLVVVASSYPQKQIEP